MWILSFFVDSSCKQCRRNENLTIKELALKGDTKLEIKLAGGKNTIDTLNHQAKLLHLKVNNENSDKLNITTLNQTGANSDTQIFNKIKVEDFNLSGGKAHQLAGEITNLNITNGHSIKVSIMAALVAIVMLKSQVALLQRWI
ncbi:hypothetical protein [Helicobacter canis]|nr:hypothetical protein [Helicobacter canis]